MTFDTDVFIAGALGGLRAWRPAVLVAVGTVVTVLTLGTL